jgi:Family of unknown function (DUF6335)
VPIDRQPTAEPSALRGVPEDPSGLTVAGGDPDADVMRAGSVGEEAPGGSVATPDQDRVDDAGSALGVPRALDEEFRTSAEILEDRERYRREEEE